MQKFFVLAASLLAAAVFVSIAIFVWLMWAVGTESEMALRSEFWHVLGDRAIQLDRIGEVGRPRFFQSRVYISPEAWQKIDSLNCSSKIEVERTSLLEYGSVSVGIKHNDPWVVYLFYFGPAPNFSAVISARGAREYFGPQALLDAKGSNDSNKDYRRKFDQYIAGRNFSWHSVECEFFTFTVIKEQ